MGAKTEFSFILKADATQLDAKLKAVDNELEKMRGSAEKRSKAMTSFVEGANVQSVKQQLKAWKGFQADRKQMLDDELKHFKGNLLAQEKAHKDYLKDIEAAEKKHYERVKTLAAQGGIGNQLRGQLATAKKDIADTFKGGDIMGGIGKTAMAFGPIGLAIGAGFTAIREGILHAAEAFDEFEVGAAKVKQVLDPSQLNDFDKSMENLRIQATQTGTPIQELQGGFARLLTQVPALRDNLVQGTAVMGQVDKASKALGLSTDQTVEGMSNLAAAFGLNLNSGENVNKVLDTLASTLQNSSIPNMETYMNLIGTGAAGFSELTAGGQDAVGMMGAMISTLTQGGAKTGSVGIAIKSLTGELLDNEKASKLLSMGFGGLTKNLETGQIQVSDWGKLMTDLKGRSGEAFEVLNNQLVQDTIRNLARNGGADFEKMIQTITNSGGAVEKKFQDMANTGAFEGARMKAAWNDLFISMGESADSAMDNAQGAIADVLTYVGNLIKSNAQLADESVAKAAANKATLDSLNQAVATASQAGPGIDPTVQLDAIKAVMGEIQAVAPGTAAAMQAIITSGQATTPEGMAELVSMLKEVQGIQAASTIDELNNSMDLLKKSMADLSEENKSIWASMIEGVSEVAAMGVRGLTAISTLGLSEVFGFGSEMTDMADQVGEALDSTMTEKIAASKTRVDELKVALEQARAAGDSERERELAKALNEERLNGLKLKESERDMQEQATDLAEKYYDAQKAAAEASGETFDKAEALATVNAMLTEELGNQPDMIAEANSQLADRLYMEEESLLIKQAESEAVAEVSDLLAEQGITEASNLNDKIAALETIKAQNDAQIGQLEMAILGQENLIAAEEAKLQLMNKEIEAQNQINIAQGVAAAGQQVVLEGHKATLSNMKAQLAGLKAQNAEVDKQVASLRKPKAAAAGGAGGGRARAGGAGGAAARAEKDAEKAEKEKQKEAEKLRKDEENARKRALEEQERAMKQAAADAKKAREDALKYAEDRRKAEEEMIKHLKDFANALSEAFNSIKTKNLDEIASIGDKYDSEFARLVEGFDKRIKEVEDSISKNFTGPLIDKQKLLNEAIDNRIAREKGATVLQEKADFLQPIIDIFQGAIGSRIRASVSDQGGTPRTEITSIDDLTILIKQWIEHNQRQVAEANKNARPGAPLAREKPLADIIFDKLSGYNIQLDKMNDGWKEINTSIEEQTKRVDEARDAENKLKGELDSLIAKEKDIPVLRLGADFTNAAANADTLVDALAPMLDTLEQMQTVASSEDLAKLIESYNKQMERFNKRVEESALPAKNLEQIVKVQEELVEKSRQYGDVLATNVSELKKPIDKLKESYFTLSLAQGQFIEKAKEVAWKEFIDQYNAVANEFMTDAEKQEQAADKQEKAIEIVHKAMKAGVITLEEMHARIKAIINEPTEEEKQKQFLDELYTNVKAGLDQVLKTMQAIADTSGKVLGVMDGMINKGQTLDLTVRDVASGSADLAQKLTGLPIADIFNAGYEAVKNVIAAIEMLVAENDAYYQAQKKAIKDFYEFLDQYDAAITKASVLNDIESKLNVIYASRLDMGAEQAKASEEDAAVASANITTLINQFDNLVKAGGRAGQATKDLFGEFDPSKPDTFMKAADRVADRLAYNRANAAYQEQNLTKDLSAADRRRSQQSLDASNAEIKVLEAIQEQMGIYLDSIANAAQLRQQVFRDQLAELEHRKNMGEFDDKEEAFLQNKLSILDGLLAQAKKDFELGHITQQELWSIEEERYSVEQEILNLHKAQNDELSEQSKKYDEILRKLHMERQALILKARQGAALTPEERARIKEVEDSIIAQMKAAGAGESAIAAAIEGFATASYAVGTPYVPETGAALLHKGERVVTADDNKMLTEYLKRDPFESIRPILESFAYWMSQGNTMVGGNTNNAQINININGAKDPRATGAEVEAVLKKYHTGWHIQDGSWNGR